MIYFIDDRRGKQTAHEAVSHLVAFFPAFSELLVAAIPDMALSTYDQTARVGSVAMVTRLVVPLP